MKALEKQKKVLFAGRLYGELLKKIVKIGNTSYAIQKFNSNIVDVLKMKYDTCVLSPVRYTGKMPKSETNNGTVYNYIQYDGYWGRFKILLSGCFYNFKLQNGVIIADALNLMLTSGLLFSKKLGKNRVILIVTDIPDDILNNKNTLYSRLFLKNLKVADGFIFLTEQTNRDYNVKKKPYVIMEGIASKCEEIVGKKGKISVYAGGLEEKNNIVQMIDAFDNVARGEECLYIFGDGNPKYRRYVESKSKNTNHIKYMGVAPNEEVVKYEKQAQLLINPRTNSGEFTKYSFPSKFIEYLNSGTPALINKLEGIPEEYYSVVILFSGDKLSDYENSIRQSLDLDDEEKMELGEKARKFIQMRNGWESSLHKLEKLVDQI